jgi:hypothetical protein
VVLAAVAAGFGVLVGNKVFSPQYLLWLVPLVPLLPFAWPKRRLVLGWFLVICLLTTVLWRVFVAQVMRPVEPGSDAMLGPTPLGAGLILVRNALVVGLTVYLNWQLFRRTADEVRASPER